MKLSSRWRWSLRNAEVGRGYVPCVEPLETRALPSTVTTTLTAAADAYVRGGTYAATNYGKAAQLVVANDVKTSNDRETYLRFDLSGVSGQVVAAALKLVPSSLGSDVAAATFRVSLLADGNDAWVEGNGGTDNNPTGEITWNNRPLATTPSVSFSGARLALNQPITIDVTSLVNSAGNGNKLSSFRIDSTSAAGARRVAMFNSREAATAAYRPVLEVTLDQPTVTPSAWPQRVFSPYVDATNWPPFDLVQTAQNQGIAFFNLAFIVADGSHQPSWGGYYSVASGYRLDEIQTLRQLGGDVMVSFGGAAGTELAVAITDVNALTSAYQSVIDTYRLTHVDFDIEGAWVADRASIDRRSQALRNLEDRAAADGRVLSVWFTLPVLPSGLTADGLYVIQSALEHGVMIGGVNIMAMDYGDSTAPSPDGQMGEYAIQAAQSLFGQLKSHYAAAGQSKSDADLWHLIGVTPMIGQNDVNSERFYQEDAQELLTFGQQQNLGMISMWSANRDNGSVPVGQLSGNGSGITQTSFEFSHIFEAVSGPATPTLSIGNASIAEGNSGTAAATFTVTLSVAQPTPVTVSFNTKDGSARAGEDYQAVSGTLTFAAGETQKTIQVPVFGDLTAESNETFSVNLSGAGGAAIFKAQGTGTIRDDDTPTAGQVSFVATSQWDSGFIGQVTITNTSSKNWTGWTLEFDYPFQITSIWSAEIVSHVGDHYVVRPADWTRGVNAGSQITFGFEATPGNPTAPSNVRLVAEIA